METSYNRILACSLNAYAAFWDELANSPANSKDENNHNVNDNWEDGQNKKWKELNASIEKTKSIQNSILNEGKFWKFSQSKDHAVSINGYIIQGLAGAKCKIIKLIREKFRNLGK